MGIFRMARAGVRLESKHSPRPLHLVSGDNQSQEQFLVGDDFSLSVQDLDIFDVALQKHIDSSGMMGRVANHASPGRGFVAKIARICLDFAEEYKDQKVLKHEQVIKLTEVQRYGGRRLFDVKGNVDRVVTDAAGIDYKIAQQCAVIIKAVLAMPKSLLLDSKAEFQPWVGEFLTPGRLNAAIGKFGRHEVERQLEVGLGLILSYALPEVRTLLSGNDPDSNVASFAEILLNTVGKMLKDIADLRVGSEQLKSHLEELKEEPQSEDERTFILNAKNLLMASIENVEALEKDPTLNLAAIPAKWMEAVNELFFIRKKFPDLYAQYIREFNQFYPNTNVLTDSAFNKWNSNLNIGGKLVEYEEHLRNLEKLGEKGVNDLYKKATTSLSKSRSTKNVEKFFAAAESAKCLGAVRTRLNDFKGASFVSVIAEDLYSGLRQLAQPILELTDSKHASTVNPLISKLNSIVAVKEHQFVAGMFPEKTHSTSKQFFDRSGERFVKFDSSDLQQLESQHTLLKDTIMVVAAVKKYDEAKQVLQDIPGINEVTNALDAGCKRSLEDFAKNDERFKSQELVNSIKLVGSFSAFKSLYSKDSDQQKQDKQADPLVSSAEQFLVNQIRLAGDLLKQPEPRVEKEIQKQLEVVNTTVANATNAMEALYALKSQVGSEKLSENVKQVGEKLNRLAENFLLEQLNKSEAGKLLALVSSIKDLRLTLSNCEKFPITIDHNYPLTQGANSHTQRLVDDIKEIKDFKTFSATLVERVSFMSVLQACEHAMLTMRDTVESRVLREQLTKRLSEAVQSYELNNVAELGAITKELKEKLPVIVSLNAMENAVPTSALSATQRAAVNTVTLTAAVLASELLALPLSSETSVRLIQFAGVLDLVAVIVRTGAAESVAKLNGLVQQLLLGDSDAFLNFSNALQGLVIVAAPSAAMEKESSFSQAAEKTFKDVDSKLVAMANRAKMTRALDQFKQAADSLTNEEPIAKHAVKLDVEAKRVSFDLAPAMKHFAEAQSMVAQKSLHDVKAIHQLKVTTACATKAVEALAAYKTELKKTHPDAIQQLGDQLYQQGCQLLNKQLGTPVDAEWMPLTKAIYYATTQVKSLNIPVNNIYDKECVLTQVAQDHNVALISKIQDTKSFDNFTDSLYKRMRFLRALQQCEYVTNELLDESFRDFLTQKLGELVTAYHDELGNIDELIQEIDQITAVVSPLSNLKEAADGVPAKYRRIGEAANTACQISTEVIRELVTAAPSPERRQTFQHVAHALTVAVSATKNPSRDFAVELNRVSELLPSQSNTLLQLKGALYFLVGVISLIVGASTTASAFFAKGSHCLAKGRQQSIAKAISNHGSAVDTAAAKEEKERISRSADREPLSMGRSYK
jgi:hypothetical protein